MEKIAFTPIFIKIGKIFILVLSYFLAKIFLKKIINFFFLNIEKASLFAQRQRIKTLKSLIKNTLQYAIFFIIFILIIKELGFDITLFITGAGILGLAFSFGAQTLVKDLIAGFFIILENQFNVGDQVQLNTERGTVYKITLRSTILKDEKNNLIHLPNSEIKKIIIFAKNTKN